MNKIICIFELKRMNKLGKRLDFLMNHNMIGVNQLVRETTISQPTISRILKDSRNYKPNKNTIRYLCDFFKIPYDFLLDGKLTCENCFNEINFDLHIESNNYRCLKCASKLYHYIPVVTLSSENDLISGLSKREIKSIIDEYKLLYSHLKSLIEKNHNNEIDNLTFNKLVEYKEKVDMKKDIYEKIEQLTNLHNSKLK